MLTIPYLGFINFTSNIKTKVNCCNSIQNKPLRLTSIILLWLHLGKSNFERPEIAILGWKQRYMLYSMNETWIY
jgi:hypothetical protein